MSAKNFETEVTKRKVCYLRRRNLRILFNNTTLIPFKWRNKYLCFYCGDDARLDQLRQHTKSHGPCNDRDRAIRIATATKLEIKIDVSDVTCEICSESFTCLDDIIDHLIFEHQMPYDKEVELPLAGYRLIDLQCLLCDESFDFLSKLISHVNTAHPNNCFMCTVCKKTFNKKRDAHFHFKTRHMESYSCGKCDKTFPRYCELQIHKSKAHSSKCNICLQVFPSDRLRLAHQNSEHQQTHCVFCGKFIATKLGFKRHATTCERKPKEETVVVEENNKMFLKKVRKSLAAIFGMTTALPFKFFMNRFRCFYCTRDFTYCQDLKVHSFSEHTDCGSTFKWTRRSICDGFQIKVDISTLSCRLCHTDLDDLNDLIDHLDKEHDVKCDTAVKRNLLPFKLIKDNYPCPFCDEVYRYFGVLLKHVSVAHNGNKHICVYCGKAFRTEANRYAHVSRNHKIYDNLRCTICNQQFRTGSALKNHQGSVHGTKIFPCRQCSEKFPSEYSVLKHLITAHGIGHKCTYCDRLFTKNSFMVNHIRLHHLNEKNLECSVCFDKFFYINALKRHMAKHTGEPNFQCDICGKKFLWKTGLKRHIAIHIRKSDA